MSWIGRLFSQEQPVSFQQPGMPLRDSNQNNMEAEDGFLFPHYRTFAAVWNGLNQTYRSYFDEALKHSTTNALAMRRDTYTESLLQERWLPICHLPWRIKSEDEKNPIQQLVTAGLTRIMKRIRGWVLYRYALQEAEWYGRFGVQMQYGPVQINGMWQLGVSTHEPVNGDKIQFGWDRVPRIMIASSEEKYFREKGATVVNIDRAPAVVLDNPKWRERFCIHKHIPTDSDFFEGDKGGQIHGRGIRDMIYWLWWMRSEMLGWAINHVKKLSIGGILIFPYDEANPKSKLAAENAAKDAGDRYALSMPIKQGQTKLSYEPIYLPLNSAGVNLLSDMVDGYIDRRIERLIVGQSMSSGGGGKGGLEGDGRAQFAKETKYQIVKFGAANSDDTITYDLLHVLKRWNYPWAGFHVWFESDVRDPSEDRQKLEGFERLYKMKIPFKSDDARVAAGAQKPELGDETTLDRTPVLPPGMPGAEPPAMN